MALHETEQILDAALVDVGGVHVAEVVPEERPHLLRVLAELVGDGGATSGDLCDLLRLLLLEFGLECRHDPAHLLRGGAPRRAPI